MKKVALILAMMVSLAASAQVYVSASFSHYNGGGNFNQQGMVTGEIGYTIQKTLSLGVAGGVTSFSNTNPYLEFRPSVTLWSYRNFSVSGSLGAGYVFNTPENFLTEYCGTINWAFAGNLSASVFGGGYSFNGKQSASKYTFVGAGLTLSLGRNNDATTRFPGMVHSKARY